MKILSAVFQLSAPDIESCPKSDRPEFAFIGRSNVGKSSLINCLTGNSKLAKVSGTPGKTRLINFFAINNRWTLVDLPGYGYAKINKGARHEFNQAVADYLEERENLSRVFVLIDSRLPPQTIDLDFTRWLAMTGVGFDLIFTKADKQGASQTSAKVAEFKRALTAHGVAAPERVFISSATAGKGRAEILAHIGALADA
ncbi:MAG: ribosome biogenesis GTP-binding protein YihA/YsxC [Verrucomicrobiota bacterium]